MNEVSQRPLTDADAPAFAALTDALCRADAGYHRVDEAEFRYHLNHPLRFATHSLGVDADSPTGAVGVYERAGFEVERKYVFYNKVFEV